MQSQLTQEMLKKIFSSQNHFFTGRVIDINNDTQTGTLENFTNISGKRQSKYLMQFTKNQFGENKHSTYFVQAKLSNFEIKLGKVYVVKTNENSKNNFSSQKLKMVGKASDNLSQNLTDILRNLMFEKCGETYKDEGVVFYKQKLLRYKELKSKAVSSSEENYFKEQIHRCNLTKKLFLQNENLQEQMVLNH